MKREFRLTRTTDFKRVRKYGKSYVHPLLVLIVQASSNPGVRVGVAAGRSVGNAVIRNRVKRRLRACMDGLLPRLTPGMDILLLARKPIVFARFDEIFTVVAQLLHQAGLLIEKESVDGSSGSISNEPRLRDLPFRLINLPRIALLGLFRTYQVVVSPLLPQNTCRFYPSCSHYGYQAVYKHGVLKGSWMAVKRVFRCNPFNPGGYDPVP